MPTARWWKDFYAAERSAVGERGFDGMFERAPPLDMAAGEALIFPHVRLSTCGPQVAAVARAVVDSGCDSVLALGVLHGGGARDAGQMKLARAGDPVAAARLRRVHGPGVAGDEGAWEDEYSLDGFEALLAHAARRAGRAAPRLIARYPLLVGAHPDDLPGLDDLRRHRASGAALVATGDHVHHGAAYGTPLARRIAVDDGAATSLARRTVEASLHLLAQGHVAGFLRLAAEQASDFRDPGAVMTRLMGDPWEPRCLDVRVADYADVLGGESPCWVASVLAAMTPAEPPPPSRPVGRSAGRAAARSAGRSSGGCG